MRILRKNQKCEAPKCRKKAVALVFDRRNTTGIFALCEEHAEELAHYDNSEYVQTCPNCGCKSGIN